MDDFGTPPPNQAALAKIELSSALRGHSTTMYGRLLQATRTATCRIYRSRRWCSRGVASGSSGDGRTLDVARLDGGLKGAETLTVPSGRFPGSPVCLCGQRWASRRVIDYKLDRHCCRPIHLRSCRVLWFCQSEPSLYYCCRLPVHQGKIQQQRLSFALSLASCGQCTAPKHRTARV